MEFINRKRELSRLLAQSGSDEPGLVVVWGRRRVGKTRLLLEWAEKTDGLYLVCDESSAPIQRRYMAERVALLFPGFDDVDYPDWRSLLNRLAVEAQHAGWKGPFIIDELPYLAVAAKEIASVLQRWIDHEAKEASLTVALAGSSQRMMQGMVLDRTAPLFGRAAVSLRLQPMGAVHLKEALSLSTDREVVKWYSMWGGVPRYWELASRYTDLFEAYDDLVLDPMGPLHDEVDTLLLEDIPAAGALRPLLDAIGLGAHRLSEIAGRLCKPATSLTRGIARLQEMGFVKREIPYGESEKCKRALYKLADPFVYGWFTYVARNRSLLVEGNQSVRRSIWEGKNTMIYSVTWENLARMSISSLGADGHILGHTIWQPAGRFWHGNAPEWDVVSESVDGSYLLLGEVKWSHRCFGRKEISQLFKALVQKVVPTGTFNRNAVVIYALFVPEYEPSVTVPENCLLFDASDVIGALK